MIPEEFKEWFTDDGLLNLTKTNTNLKEENYPVWTITFYILNNSKPLQLKYSYGLYINPTNSWDNLHALATFITINNGYVGGWEFKDDWHPRSWLYFAYLQHKWWAIILYPVIMYPILLYSALNWFKRDKSINRFRLIRKTDSCILHWLMFRLPKKYFWIHLARVFYEPIMWLRFGTDWMEDMMVIYFKEPNHPNRIMARRWYEKRK